ncbi:hypothetical protein ATK30_4802 [Amycolatopsis echigonensis]|uniref:Protein phosphatase 2C-like protein n=1 Tax=Amycolatopsis echigonensis TaxID=2576905 RepID=A0A2N3WJB5_9PSEU|nr:PP2C family serine/threonine-protein phosphatase [Amycolatopsis niigatensis]PKV93942.1 hypothetical protein ATK30_4802 [Amycolatopsis niigatensis]
MHVTTAQLPPAHASDDKIFATPDAVIVLDGASAFRPVPVPASDYADKLGRHIVVSLERDPSVDLRAALRSAIEKTAEELSLTPGDSPSSTVTILRRKGPSVDVLALGDSVIVLPDEVVTDDRIDDLNLEPRRLYRERLASGKGYDDTHRRLLRELQEQQAVRRNAEGGYWIAEAVPDAADHAVTASFSVEAVPWAVLATDGAYDVMTHLGLDDWPVLSKADGAELSALLERCQSWEDEVDPAAVSLPRAKRHDDKAIAVVDVWS